MSNVRPHQTRPVPPRRKTKPAPFTLMPIDLARAQKKLRQAEFFLAHLHHAAEDMTQQLRQAREPNPEPLEFWFSACLSAAQSVYYVLEATGGANFKEVQAVWRGTLGGRAGNEFGWIIGVRGDDVHLATVPGNVMPKMVPAPTSEQQWQWGNDDSFGQLAPTPHKNPDGGLVSSSVAVSSLGLYIDTPVGERVDAETLCRGFIDHLASLLKHAAQDLGPSSQ